MQRRRACRLFPEKAAPPGGEAPAFAKFGKTLDSQAARLGGGWTVTPRRAAGCAPGPRPEACQRAARRGCLRAQAASVPPASESHGATPPAEPPC